MEEWRVERLQEVPSAQDFASQVEPRNLPVVYEKSVENWPAYSKWNPAMGGLDYLKGIAKGEAVQAMLSTSGSNFYGDIRSHERVALSFGEYLDHASEVYFKLEALQKEDGFSDDNGVNKRRTNHLPEGAHLYLAQAPMFNKDQQEITPLRVLMQDITMPRCLTGSLVANVNLWMSASESKSSTHYDPYHNMLCVVVGQKQVTLWPPCATPFLYPHPVYGEASNHSSVDFVKPDIKMHPLISHATKLCQMVLLKAGDALFIPEGWFHQVNSESLTLAVNLWWPSHVSLALNSHMDGYYLRRVVGSLLDGEKKRLVQMATSGQARSKSSDAHKVLLSNLKQAEVKAQDTELDNEEEGRDEWIGRNEAVQSLMPLQKQCLQYLFLSCMSHGNVNVTLEQTDELDMKNSPPTILVENLIAEVFTILGPSDLKQILMVMAKHFPRTLEVLVLHKLSPLAAEVLTSRFDEMDSAFPESEQAEFYKAFYSVFEDPKLAMSAFLDGKEAFSAAALKSVLEGYLGFGVQ